MMSGTGEHRRVVAWLAWHAAGTLGDDERAEVERHVEECAECRELLEAARRNAGLAPLAPVDAMLEHVDPLLLVQYVEEPDSLEPWTIELIEERLAACEDCRDALARLRELAPDAARSRAAAGSGITGLLQRGWRMLGSTLLRPEPALVYLVLLLVVLPGWLMVREPAPGERGGAIFAPAAVVRLEGESVVRDTGAERGPPVELRSSADEGPLLLELVTELRPEDRDTFDALRIELVRDGDVIWSAERPADALVEIDGRLAVPLLLGPDVLERNGVHELRVRSLAPGRLIDGVVLYRRRVVVRGGPVAGESS